MAFLPLFKEDVRWGKRANLHWRKMLSSQSRESKQSLIVPSFPSMASCLPIFMALPSSSLRNGHVFTRKIRNKNRISSSTRSLFTAKKGRRILSLSQIQAAGTCTLAIGSRMLRSKLLASSCSSLEMASKCSPNSRASKKVWNWKQFLANCRASEALERSAESKA